jgi:hypothetical protein
VNHARDHVANRIGFCPDSRQRVSATLPLGRLRRFLCTPDAVGARLRGSDRVATSLFGRE